MSQSYSKSIAYFKNAGIVWTILGLVGSLLNEMQMMFFIPGSDSPISYGILKSITADITIFGGVLSLFLAYALRILNKEGAKQKIDIFAMIAFGLLQLGLVIGVVVMAAGFSSGREYGEFNYHSDNIILLALAIVLGLSIYNLKGQKLSAAAQFLIVTLAGMLVSFFLGNFGFPNSILTSVPPTSGMQDATVQEFYRMAVLVYFVYLPLLTILYSAIPEKFGGEIASLPAVRFQLIASMVLVPLAAGSGLLYTVAPQSLQIFGAFAASALAVSVLAGTVNLYQSFRNVKAAVSNNVVDDIWLGSLLLTILTALQAITRLPFAKKLLQYTAWSDADPLFTTMTGGLIILALAVSMLNSNGKKGLATWAMMALAAGAVVAIPASLIQGIIEGWKALALTGTAPGQTLQYAGWTTISSASTLLSGTASPAMQYLVSLNGLVLISKLLFLVGFAPLVSAFFETEADTKAGR